MSADIKSLKKIVKFMQKEGILALKLPELELTLSPQAMFPVEQSKIQPEAQPTDTPIYTPEEIMMWSVPGFLPSEEGAI